MGRDRPERYDRMHSTGGKNGSSEVRPSSAHPATRHDSDTIDTPTTDLLPLLSEAQTARVESEFEDVPEVVAEIPSSPPQSFVMNWDRADDTINDAVDQVEWIAEPFSPLPSYYENAPDVIDIEEEDLPELVVPAPTESTFIPSGPGLAAAESPQGFEASSRGMEMVEEMVELIGEMEEDAEQLNRDQPESAEICRHVALRMTLMLARNGVTVIGIKEQGAVETSMGQAFDRARHQPATIDIPADGAQIIEVISPGFAVGQRILRRARVRCQ